MFWCSDIKNIFLKNKNVFIILIKQIFNVYKERKKKSIPCFFIYYLGNVEKIENERNKIKNSPLSLIYVMQLRLRMLCLRSDHHGNVFLAHKENITVNYLRVCFV
jgi:hypothetical protein